MSSAWQFYLQQPTDPIHNPISGEFFSTEAVGNVTEALIREGIQNTLDARRKKPDGSRHPASVRIFLSQESGALPSSKTQRWLSSLWPHVMASGNGLRNQPELNQACPFLVFEDFGTTGLTGNPDEHLVIEGITNHFLNFYRAEGHSDKGATDRGSWGVGKTVFPRASRISSFIGLTVRHDDNKQFILGRSILKYHRVENQSFKSDGYLGKKRHPDGFMLPTDDPSTLAEFRNDFSLTRQAESGLSIVVPWYELKGEDGISRDSVITAVLRGFFYPILMGELSVTIAVPGEDTFLDSSSIIPKVEAIGSSFALEILPTIKLAEWAQTRTPSEIQHLTAPPSDRAQTWSAELVPQTVIEHIRMSLEQRKGVALQVPMSIQSRTGGTQTTYFRIFLEHSERDSEKPCFIRDELIM